MDQLLDAKSGLAALKAVAEATRLRILLLLATAELTVKDFTQVLGQSQPRISRHLKLLHEAGLIERHREGSWVYYRLGDVAAGNGLGRRIIGAFDPDEPLFRRDRDRLQSLTAERAANAQRYFERNAADWDRLRSLYVEEAVVEGAMRAALGDQEVDLLVDLGTGTGRILELFRDVYGRGLGIDINQAMLSYARTKLEGHSYSGVQVRQGDIYNLPLEDAAADVVVMHQVLHHLSDPAAAIGEAARALRPDGKVLIVDFAPHDLDYLREEYAHERLGFSNGQVGQWLQDAGLELVTHDALAPSGERASERLTVSLWLGNKSDTVNFRPGVAGAEGSLEIAG